MNYHIAGILSCILPFSDSHFVTSKSSGLETFSGKLNEQAVFWTNERLREALASPVNSEIDSLTINKNRIRRSEADEFVWTEDALRSAVPIDNDRLSEALRQLGIYPSEMPPSGTEPSPKQIADVNEYPYNNFGKLFVSDSRGSHHCTAAFIRERILITAAHCVKHANGDVYDHIRFYQRFNGMEDQGRIVEVEQIFIPPSYIDEHGMIDLRFDYAFLTTTESDDVTTLGYDFSGVVPPNEQIYFAGYPVDHEGELKLISSSGTRNSDIRELIHVPQNPLKSGSGGGPWLLRHTDENYQVIGVASHGKPARGIPGAFSPVLNAETAKLLQIAERTVETSSSEDTETVTSGPDVQLYTTS